MDIITRLSEYLSKFNLNLNSISDSFKIEIELQYSQLQMGCCLFNPQKIRS